VALGDRLAAAADAVKGRRVGGVDQRLGLEAGVVFD